MLVSTFQRNEPERYAEDIAVKDALPIALCQKSKWPSFNVKVLAHDDEKTSSFINFLTPTQVNARRPTYQRQPWISSIKDLRGRNQTHSIGLLRNLPSRESSNQGIMPSVNNAQAYSSSKSRDLT